MAKGDLGEYYSILGTAQQASFNAQRKALEDERKKARRDRYLSYLAEPVIGAVGKEIVSLVKTPFEEKYKDFANSAVAIQQKVKTRAADTDGDAFEYKEKERAAYAGGEDAWFANYSTKEAERKFLLANPEDGEAKLKTSIYNSQISEAAKIIETAKREEVKKERKLLDDYRATGKLEDNLKNRRTKTISGRFIDLFQGDSTEKQDARAQEEFEKSLYNTSREAYLNFRLDIEEGVPLVEAAQKAKESLPSQADIAWGKDFTTQRTFETTDTDGNKVFSTEISTYNRLSDEFKNGGNPISVVTTQTELLTPKKEAEIEANLVKEANIQFNYTTRARTDFTPEAYLNFKAEVEKKGVKITDIKTMEERQIVADIYDTYDKLDNYKEEAKTKQAIENRDIARADNLTSTDVQFQNSLNKYIKRDKKFDEKPGPSATAEDQKKYQDNQIIIQDYKDNQKRMELLLADAKVAAQRSSLTPPPPPAVAKDDEEEEEAPVTTALPAPKPKEGATWNDANGNPLIFKGGTWVPDPNPDGAI
jgi:hypothetical protein